MRELAGFLVFVLAVYGLATAIAVLKTRVVAQAVFGRVPILRDLVKCPPCLAFWIGMAFSFWLLSPASAFVAVRWKATVLDGLAACGTVWLLHAWAERLTHGLDL